MKRQKLEIGERITFKAVTRAGAPTLTRVVNGFHFTGEPTVRAHGHGDFVVHWKEISAVHPRENSN